MPPKPKNADAQQTTLVPDPAAGAPTTALAKPSPATPLALPTHDELAGVMDDVPAEAFVNDGLSEVDREDIKLALKVWNMNGIDPETRRQIPKDVFYDTVTEQQSTELELVLLDLSKSNEWREFLQAEKKSVIHCRSQDRITGTMADGTMRPCEGCPDAQWTTNAEGKRNRNCSDVYSVGALEMATRQLCVLRFKRTSLGAFKQHLNRHHIGRRVLAGRRANYPLFAFRVKLTLEMDEGGVFARPILEKLGPVTREDFLMAAELTKYYRDALLPHLAKVAERDVSEDGGAPAQDASFDTSQFVDAPPAGAVPVEGAQQPGGFAHE